MERLKLFCSRINGCWLDSILTVRYELVAAAEPGVRDVLPVREEDEGERVVERDARARRDLAAVAPAERGVDQRAHVRAGDLGEQVQVFVVAPEGY